MKTAAPRCEKAFKASCVDTFDAMGCGAAASFCAAELQAPFWQSGGCDLSGPGMWLRRDRHEPVRYQ
jgi:hypothetical protein